MNPPIQVRILAREPNSGSWGGCLTGGRARRNAVDDQGCCGGPFVTWTIRRFRSAARRGPGRMSVWRDGASPPLPLRSIRCSPAPLPAKPLQTRQWASHRGGGRGRPLFCPRTVKNTLTTRQGATRVLTATRKTRSPCSGIRRKNHSTSGSFGSNLTVLWLHGNQLTSPIPPELGELTLLEWLWLHTNQLSSAISWELGNLSSLTNLEISGNQIVSCIPPALRMCNQVYELH